MTKKKMSLMKSFVSAPMLLQLLLHPEVLFAVHAQQQQQQEYITHEFTGQMELAPITTTSDTDLSLTVLQVWNGLTSNFFESFFIVDLRTVMEGLDAVENFQAEFRAINSTLSQVGQSTRTKVAIDFMAQISYTSTSHQTWNWDPAELMLGVYNTDELYTNLVFAYRNSAVREFLNINSIVLWTLASTRTSVFPYESCIPRLGFCEGVARQCCDGTECSPYFSGQPRICRDVEVTSNPTVVPETKSPTNAPIVAISPTESPTSSTKEPTNYPTTSEPTISTPYPTSGPRPPVMVTNASGDDGDDGGTTTTSPPTSASVTPVPTHTRISESGDGGSGNGGGDFIGGTNMDQNDDVPFPSTLREQNQEESVGVFVIVAFAVAFVAALVVGIGYYYYKTKERRAVSDSNDQHAIVGYPDAASSNGVENPSGMILVKPETEEGDGDISELENPNYLVDLDDELDDDEENTYADKTATDISKTTQYRDLLHARSNSTSSCSCSCDEWMDCTKEQHPDQPAQMPALSPDISASTPNDDDDV